jgi:NitT/TauT family transport system substrate-binding protein
MRLGQRQGIGRTVAVFAVVILLVVAGIAFYFFLDSSSRDKVIMTLEFSPSSYHSSYYYGVSQGIYGNNGINLTIMPQKNSGGSISAVSSGQAQFGLADATALILSLTTSNITNVRIIAITFERNYFAIIYNKADIHAIGDLAGKTAGATSPSAGGAATKLFSLLAKDNNINLSSIHFQYASASVYYPLLVNGKLQFALSTGHALPSLQAAAAHSGIALGAFDFPDYGVDTYGEALITSTQMIQQHSDLVKRFVTATLESVKAGIGDQSAAVSALVAAEPQMNYTQTLTGFQIDIACCAKNTSGLSNALQIGWIDPSRMQQTVNIVVNGLGIHIPVNASNLYTDEYVMQPAG